MKTLFKPLIKAILKKYLDEKHFEDAIMLAFYKDFDFTDEISGTRTRKPAIKVKRRFVYEAIERNLRYTKRCDFDRGRMYKILIKHGAIPTASAGYYYFKGIKPKTYNQSNC